MGASCGTAETILGLLLWRRHQEDKSIHAIVDFAIPTETGFTIPARTFLIATTNFGNCEGSPMGTLCEGRSRRS